MQDRLRAGVEFKLENVKLHFRRTSVVLLATASLICSLPAWSQNATDWWQAEGRSVVFRLRATALPHMQTVRPSVLKTKNRARC